FSLGPPFLIHETTYKPSRSTQVQKFTTSQALIVCHADQVDLDQRVFDQQASRTDRRARWRDPEIFLPHLVEAVEVIEIGEKDLRLDDLIERTSCCFESSLEVFQDVASLQLNV